MAVTTTGRPTRRGVSDVPYCEEHNEVYRAEECPKCAGDATAESASSSGTSTGGGSIDDVVEDALDGVTDGVDGVDGDVVVGEQSKSVDSTTEVNVDQSKTVVDESTEVHDDSTTVTDSVVQGSDIGSEDGGTEVEDSVVKDSSVGSEGRQDAVDTGGRTVDQGATGGLAGDSATEEPADTQFCVYCGDEIPARAANCPSCGEELPE